MIKSQKSKKKLTCERNGYSKEALSRTAPLRYNPEIIFPNEHKKGRIRMQSGTRILDWEGNEWRVYEKESTTWTNDEIKEEDYEKLWDCLKEQIFVGVSKNKLIS